ncbi:MAG: ABC transporter substrate-binding protein [Verrucomicrobiales bacterium]|nr:ABC transporter substrate-binding protein [Verrucomicrobiales bacterium]
MKANLIRLVYTATACAALAMLVPGCGDGGGGAAAGSGATIKVGEYASMTGKEATFGQSSHGGTLLAVEEVNAAGGVLGKKLELITEDTQSKAGEPATVVRKLITRDQVIAVLGEVASSRSLEAAPIAQQFKVPMISPSSTNPKVTEVGDYVFRVCFIDPFQGTVMANFAWNTLKVRKVAVLTDVKSDYSLGLAQYFKQRFEQLGGKMVIDQSFSGGDKDFKAQLTAIKAAGPDGLFIPAYYTDVGLIARQAKELGINFPLFGGDGWESPKLIELGGEAVEGKFYSTHYSPEDPSAAVKEFVKRYQARFKGEAPDAMAALGYDSVMVLVDAIKRAGGTDGPKLRDALAATRDFEGVTGRTTMDPQRNASKSAVIITVKNGQFAFVEKINP